MAQSQVPSVRPKSPGGKGITLAKAEERTAWWLLLPSFLVLLTVAIYPLGSVFYSSFTNARFASADPTQLVGFNNYRQLLSVTIHSVPFEVNPETGERDYANSRLFLRRLDTNLTFDEVISFNLFGNRYVLGASNADFIKAVIDTIYFTVVTVFFETILGMIIALTLASRFFGRNLMRTAMLVPWAIITVVSGLIWEWMYKSNASGLFNALIRYSGLGKGTVNFLTEPALQMPSIMAAEIWKTTPFMALLLLAGLSTIPKELYEAARVDGASKVRQFFSVTLPLLVPTLAVALIFRTLDALRVFDLFQVVFGERRYSMASFAQDILISNRDVGLSSAASVVIFFLTFIFAILYIRALGVDNE